MQDAKRFRAQAERCLQMARLMSDPTLAARFNAEAADHLARAMALEAEVDQPMLKS
jgi:hypothetical protein